MTTPTHGPGSGQLDLLAPATPFPGPAGMMDPVSYTHLTLPTTPYV
mgnify:CR=1 FL=1